jgi:sulfite reductase (ferredoxin)
VNDLLINISGCPNSCAQQRWSDIGFSGKVMRNGRNLPAYIVYAGAKRGEEGELSNSFGSVSAKDLPNFIHDLLAIYLGVKANYATFRDFVKGEGLLEIAKLVEKYAEVPTFEENPDYYFDWGSTELFSVINKGPAECSAGLFDLIDVDAKNIQKALIALPETKEESNINQLLYAIVFAASRMLLVTRGAEPKTTEEVFDLFVQKFIREGYVDAKYQPIVEVAKAGAQSSFLANKDQIISLASDVTKLYESMDDSLQFKV